MLKAHSRLFEHLMLAGDLALIAGSWLLAYYLRFSVGPISVYYGVPPIGPYLVLLVPIVVVWAVAFRAFDLYRPRRIGSRLKEVGDVAKASTVGVLVLVALTFFAFARRFEFSRVVIAYFWVLSIAAVSLSRAVFRETLRVARRHGLNLRHAVVVGGGELARAVIGRLRRRPDVGIHVLGVVGDGEEDQDLGASRLGGYRDLRAILDRGGVDHVILAIPHEDYARIGMILEAIGDEPVTIHIVPDLIRFTSLGGGVEEFEGLPFVHLRVSPLYGWSVVLKRVADVGLASVALLAAAPLMALIAVAIRFTSSGPVFYAQERMGLDGRVFRMLKFRSMRLGAEDETGPVWARADDPRVTRIGRWLRRTSLDELPQLINVLRGEMSLVGPRPERPELIESFRKAIPRYMLRHKMKAGMTGWAQINGWRGNTSLEKRIEYDLYYIENWSLLFDLRILWLTLWRGFRHKHAY